ncbi:unnamed protein product [Gulo gulo]|uniref:Uncharacterized protein n=1 Tax=Gulo gulo TaxID=48420 RepID=A0A9X9LW80_GULGU|nr:unnamed protein product [Gulo gulo]
MFEHGKSVDGIPVKVNMDFLCIYMEGEVIQVVRGM